MISKNKIFQIFLLFFLVVSLVVAVLMVVKTLFLEQKYIFAKIKMGQGLWWAYTGRPNFWFVGAIKRGDKEYDLVGNTRAEILKVRYYPSRQDANQYETYLTAKLVVKIDKKTNRYLFKRLPIGVGSPIELEFPSTPITGTIIALSPKNFDERYQEKIIHLKLPRGYRRDATDDFDNIKIGDKYFDGQENVFEILEKNLKPNVFLVENNLNGRVYEQQVFGQQDIIVKAKIKVKEDRKRLIYGEEEILRLGSQPTFITENFNYSSFFFIDIQDVK